MTAALHLARPRRRRDAGAHRRGDRRGHHRHRGARRRAHRAGDHPVREPGLGPPPAGAPAAARAGRAGPRPSAPSPSCTGGSTPKGGPTSSGSPPSRRGASCPPAGSPSPTRACSSTSWWTSREGRRSAGPRRWRSRCCARRGCCRASAWPTARCRPGPLTPVEGLQLQGAHHRGPLRAVRRVRRPLRHGRRRLRAPRGRLRRRAAGGGPRRGARSRSRGPRCPPCAAQAGMLEVRVFNPTDRPTTVRVGSRSGWLVDLRGRTLEPVDGSFELRPFGIATFRSARR